MTRHDLAAAKRQDRSNGIAEVGQDGRAAPAFIDRLDAALALAAAGWSVFPLRGKVPAIAGGRGVLDATVDPEQIRNWWTRYRGANIGARVPDGLLVLDVDPRNGGDLAALEFGNEPLPETLTCWSGRGDGGRHLYFRWSGGPISSRRLPPGIDVKISTGYCLVPPSVHPATGLPYRWEHHEIAVLPTWLRMLLRPMTVVRPSLNPTSSGGPALVGFVHTLADGNRNRGLFWAACRAVECGNLALLDDLEAAGQRIGLPFAEVRSTIASARTKASRA
ncbi:MAG: bifunctional DNA primase/polymerase [Geodermatophilaceae bacterium]|nr:bifunctional DNA primase/polymerase [Geodermatophilaceae bacterium]